MSREKLVEELIALQEQEKEIRKQLDALDYEERFNDAKQYEGRYFREVNRSKEYIRCVHVYGTCKERCEPLSLLVSYWNEEGINSYQIESYNHFYPKKWGDETDVWEEITEEEYHQHYEEVQKRITLAVSIK